MRRRRRRLVSSPAGEEGFSLPSNLRGVHTPLLFCNAMCLAQHSQRSDPTRLSENYRGRVPPLFCTLPLTPPPWCLHPRSPDMAKRHHMNNRHSRKSFQRGARVHPKNVPSGPMRGGIRL
ncbi:MAG: nonstructural protein [Microviridae sp.]|nr:MAG: nonstructural protein [Microviridae sp.]